MCNLYEHRIAVAEIADTLDQIGLDLNARSRAQNHPPDYCGADNDGPVIIADGRTASIETLRWGFPPIRDGAKPITNIRNLDSRWWTGVNGTYLTEPYYRCLVPFDRFAEWNSTAKGNAWFRTTDPAPSFFAGVWRPWTGERLKAVEGKKRRQRVKDSWRLFAFLTTEPNAVVAPIHPKAMPVILTDPSDCAEWMAGGKDSLRLQRPYPADQMTQISAYTNPAPSPP